MTDEMVAPTGPPTIDPIAPWPTLTERDDGELPGAELFMDVESHMVRPLEKWLAAVFRDQPGLADTITQRWRLSWSGGYSAADVVTDLITTRDLVADPWGDASVWSSRPMDSMSLLNAIVQLHPDWSEFEIEMAWRRDNPGVGVQRPHPWFTQLSALERILRDSGSAWRIDAVLRGLYRRVDETAQEAWRAAQAQAEGAGRVNAARFLRQAWHEVYGQQPDPNAGYAAAVKAVEAAACPVVFPSRKVTVHRVRDELFDPRRDIRTGGGSSWSRPTAWAPARGRSR